MIWTNLTIIKLIMHLCGVGIAIAFLFRERNYTSNLMLNYKIGLKPVRNSLVGTTNKEKELFVTLNKSKSKSK